MDDTQNTDMVDPYEGMTVEPSDEGGFGPDGQSGQSGDSDVIADVLAANGISDPSSIAFANPDGSVTNRSWDSLSKDEKVNIINSSNPGTTGNNLYQDEIDLINKIRESGLTPNDYLNVVERQAQEALEDKMPRAPYQIDSMSDDELYVYDAIDRLGSENVTDEELEELLVKAKSNPDLYQRTVQSLRAEYQGLEDEQNLREQQYAEAQARQDYQDFNDSVLAEIDALDSIAGQGLELTDDDKNELANYMLTLDAAGNSEFGKDINDPRSFVQMAFWALKGEDIMNEISGQIKAAYNKGLADGRGGRSQLAYKPNIRDGVVRGRPGSSAMGLDVP